MTYTSLDGNMASNFWSNIS